MVEPYQLAKRICIATSSNMANSEADWRERQRSNCFSRSFSIIFRSRAAAATSRRATSTRILLLARVQETTMGGEKIQIQHASEAMFANLFNRLPHGNIQSIQLASQRRNQRLRLGEGTLALPLDIFPMPKNRFEMKCKLWHSLSVRPCGLLFGRLGFENFFVLINHGC
jgi:hypothetical protein